MRRFRSDHSLAESTSDTLGTTTEQFQYGYDQNSNVLYKNNMVHSAASELYDANSSSSGDNATAYDPLNRLTAFRRGTLSSSGNNGSTLDTITTASATNSWTLNALGDSTSTGGVSRTVNSKNQITAISGLTSPTYDHDGNTTTDQAGNTYSYDAWNRLVFVNLPGLSTNENYTYSAGGARPGISVCNGAVTTSYYSTNWQDLEDDVVTSGPTTTKNTYLWSEAYIDELVARDTSVNGGGVTRTFAQQDANHDVTSLVNSSGTVLERFIYDPYGKQTVLNASWSTTSDSYNWIYGFQGGRLDPLTGLVNFRNRDLNSVTGTWMEQDPAGYVDGANRYSLTCNNPIKFSDPTGLDIVPQEFSLADQIEVVKEATDELRNYCDRLRNLESAIAHDCKGADATQLLKSIGSRLLDANTVLSLGLTALATNRLYPNLLVPWAQSLANWGGNGLTLIGMGFGAKNIYDAYQQGDQQQFQSSLSIEVGSGIGMLIPEIALATALGSLGKEGIESYYSHQSANLNNASHQCACDLWKDLAKSAMKDVQEWTDILKQQTAKLPGH